LARITGGRGADCSQRFEPCLVGWFRHCGSRVADEVNRRQADVAVVVATRDRPGVLGHLLEAVAAAPVGPREVVIADQSRDLRTEEVVQEHARRGLPVRYLRDGRTGLGVAQNMAFSHSSSPVVAVTDDDCVPAPDWIAAIEAAFAADPQLGGLTGPVLPLPTDDPDLVPVSSRTSTVDRMFFGRHVPWDVGSGNNFAVRREWLDIIRGNDERLGPGAPGQGGVDMDLFYRLLRAGARIRYDPRCLVHHARATRQGRLARRAPYGHGIGAAVAIWLRERDTYAIVVLARWLELRLRRLFEGIFRRNPLLVYEEALVLAGTARGLLFGARVERAPRSSYEPAAARPSGGSLV